MRFSWCVAELGIQKHAYAIWYLLMLTGIQKHKYAIWYLLMLRGIQKHTYAIWYLLMLTGIQKHTYAIWYLLMLTRIQKHTYAIWYLLMLTAVRNILHPDNSAKVTHCCFPRQQFTLYIADYYIYSNNNKKNCRFLGNTLPRTPLDVTLYVLCVSCLVVLSCLNSTQYSRRTLTARFEVLTTMLLKIKFFWDITLWFWVNILDVLKEGGASETLVTNHN